MGRAAPSHTQPNTWSGEIFIHNNTTGEYTHTMNKITRNYIEPERMAVAYVGIGICIGVLALLLLCTTL
jgi:hypothetical protein